MRPHGTGRDRIPVRHGRAEHTEQHEEYQEALVRPQKIFHRHPQFIVVLTLYGAILKNVLMQDVQEQGRERDADRGGDQGQQEAAQRGQHGAAPLATGAGAPQVNKHGGKQESDHGDVPPEGAPKAPLVAVAAVPEEGQKTQRQVAGNAQQSARRTMAERHRRARHRCRPHQPQQRSTGTGRVRQRQPLQLRFPIHFCALTICIALAIIPLISPRLDGMMMELFVLARLAKASTYFSATRRSTASRPPGELMASPTLRSASALAVASATMAAAWPWARLMAACFSPSERAIEAALSPSAILICSWRRPSEAAIRARFSRSAVIWACMACRISFGGVRSLIS